MKRLAPALLALTLLAAAPLAAQSTPPSAADTSYALGMMLADFVKQNNIELTVDAASLAAGLQDSLKGAKTRLSADQLQSVIQAAIEAGQSKKGSANLAAGKAFLAQNKNKAGVKVTSSGLQYEVITQGSGAKPKASDTVTVNYEGRLLDGTVFDSSYKRGQPATFGLSQVIRGWTEGVQLMSVGAKYRFYIPSELAYGAQGAGGSIGPNSTLIFDVELISIGK